jgi:hypothetical protein
VAIAYQPQELRTFVVLAVTDCEDNVSERRPATTIGELDIHLMILMDKLTEVNAEVLHVKQTVATLATRSYVDQQVELVNKRIEEAKPAAQLLQFAKIAGAITVIVAFFGLVYELSVTLHSVRSSMPAAAPVAKP